MEAAVHRLVVDLAVPAQAALTALDPGARSPAGARADLQRVLEHLAAYPEVEVATYDDVRSPLQLHGVVRAAAQEGLLAHPGLQRLRGADGAWDDHARALQLVLEAQGDVAGPARALHVHPNTVRYRIRRAVELSGIDVADPDERLLVQLALRAHPTR